MTVLDGDWHVIGAVRRLRAPERVGTTPPKLESSDWAWANVG